MKFCLALKAARPFLWLFAVLAPLLPVQAEAVSLTGQLRGEIYNVFHRDMKPGAIEFARGTVVLHSSLKEFYQQRDYLPAWIDDHGKARRASALVDALRGAAAEGLCGEDYRLGEIVDLMVLMEDGRQSDLLFDQYWSARLDLLLSNALIRYASHTLHGRVDPAMVFDGWKARPRTFAPALLLQHTLDSDDLQAVLERFVPPHRGYSLLKQQLARYRDLAVRGGWPKLPSGPTLRPGDTGPRVLVLKKRLEVSSEMNLAGAEAYDLYDPATEAAVRAFQRRHGLVPDGVLGPKSLAELNVSVEERIRQIELNLERWRWLPKDLGERHIAVNTADFSLKLVESGRTVLTMPVVVGTKYRKTPVFSGKMTYLEFSPYWYVPPTILREDKLPLIKKNPAWLTRNHYEIIPWRSRGGEPVDPKSINWGRISPQNFPGTLRMKPGPWNPLGQIKFMFPNRYAVYLHDTSEKHLFTRRVRLFSSGCIRIEKPLDLAQYLLEEQGVNCDQLLGTLEIQKPSRVELETPLPVHILYWTAWVDDQGQLQFRRDFYHRDLDLEMALVAIRSEEG